MAATFDPTIPAGAAARSADLGTIEITGKDGPKWLNGLVTCDVLAKKPGQGVYGLATSKVGRILSDVVVVVGEDRILVGVPRDRTVALVAAFDGYLVMEDAELADASDRLAWLLLDGPDAPSIARDVARAHGGRAADVDTTGLGGAAIVLPPAAVDAAKRSAAEAGASLVDDRAWDELRLELALPRFGVDFDDKTYPQEASLERRAVNFQKGCYLGQEVVCRLEMRGHVHRKLAAIVLAGGDVPAPGAEVKTEGGEPIGSVTSAVKSTRLGAPIALAMLKHAHAAPGERVVVGGSAGHVVERPIDAER